MNREPIAYDAFRALRNRPATVRAVHDVLDRNPVGWHMRVAYNAWLAEAIPPETTASTSLNVHSEMTMWYSVTVPSVTSYLGTEVERHVQGYIGDDPALIITPPRETE